MNAQSNAIEKALLRAGVPYRVISGVKFYERKEIKDVMSYLAVLDNPGDTVRLGRIVNEPKRGIGDATLAACQEIAAGLGLPMLEVMRTADEFAPLSKKAKPLMAFAGMMDRLAALAEENDLDRLFDAVLEETGYLKMLESQLPESQPASKTCRSSNRTSSPMSTAPRSRPWRASWRRWPCTPTWTATTRTTTAWS